MIKRLCLGIALLLVNLVSLANDSLRIAVAANFKPVLDELITSYPSDRSISVSVGSTGALTAQIQNGAPFDLFLAADTERPAYLEDQGLTRLRQTYALGQLAFWIPGSSSDVNEASLSGYKGSIAIANPRHAPYGVAAIELLAKLDKSALKQIKGSNVAQAYSFVRTGNVNAGLVALSQLLHTNVAANNYWLVPDSYHQPIEQQAVVLKSASQHADDFLAYMIGSDAREIITRSGYEVTSD